MSTLSTQDIEKKLTAIIAEIKRVDITTIELSEADDFIGKYGLTSMDAVSLSVKISQDFGFGFGQQAEDIDGLSSFGSLAQLIQQRAA